MKKIKNIIFDYGNVLFEIDFERSQKAFMALGIKNVDQVFAHAGQNPLFDAFDKGEISAADFRDGVRKIAENQALTDAEINDAWNSLLIGVPPGVHELLLNLKEKYRTFLLSNNNEIHYASILAHLESVYGVPNNHGFFERDYYSHLLGMRKPDREIFEWIINEHNLIPEETVFIDDSPQHLRAAEELGIQVQLFSTPKKIVPFIEQLLGTPATQ